MPLIDIIAGARPNFVKIAALISAFKEQGVARPELAYRLVHTGQHYDRAMSGAFFEELGIPDPDVNLEVGSGTHAEQTGAIMRKYEQLLAATRSDACVVVGDVNSTLACSIVASKATIPVAHVEAGIRSGDMSMPEEINRIVTDSISRWFFTTSRSAGRNLEQAGVSTDRIFFVGNTMIDTLLRNADRLRPPALWGERGLAAREYFVLTLHRPSNVDDEAALQTLLRNVMDGARGAPVVFPVHPRTKARLGQMTLAFDNLILTPPLGYLEFNFLVKNCKAVVTDSGGITEEATMFKVPCLTLRQTTERPETVTEGTNELIGNDPQRLAAAFARVFEGKWKVGAIPEKWDGKAGPRIVETMHRLLCAQADERSSLKL